MYVGASFVIHRHTIFCWTIKLRQNSNFDLFRFSLKKSEEESTFSIHPLFCKKFYWLQKQVFWRVNFYLRLWFGACSNFQTFGLFAAPIFSLFRIWQRFPYFYTSPNMLSNIFPEEKLVLLENTKPVWKHMDLHISLSLLVEDVKGYFSYLQWHLCQDENFCEFYLSTIYHFWLFRGTFAKCFKEFDIWAQ